uniref:Uncharacterized protein n=1 Tax=viral metagenome TaxID=1070528 RepID=A0A6C0JAY7_9ZZZZ
MSNVQSFKSVVTTRVSVPDAERIYSQSRQLGDPLGCAAVSRNYSADEFQRPIPKNINLHFDSACSNFLSSVSKRMKDEDFHRPIIGPFKSGERGKVDLMLGVSRDQIPKSLYSGKNGAFLSDFGGKIKEPQFGSKVYVPKYDSSTFREPKIGIEDAFQRPAGY